MSRGRTSSNAQPLTVLPKPRTDFKIPANCHLLITTRSHIHAWDDIGIKVIFHSSKNGIVAAKEAQNGSGMLAVANKHVVVLHDTKRGHERSWGLQADDDELRQLEYTSDAKSLYFSTSLTTGIQRYSTEHARLVGGPRTHASPPIALAVSSTGHLMVSASDGPPVVYLHKLDQDSSPILIEPRASKAAVSVATFHPERPNMFLLAFRDGTAAAYDASKIVKSGVGSVLNQENVNKGEICHMTAIHRAASIGSKRAAITDAAFLPGFKSRALTVGNDGRCRIVDFADGGEILRTWHAKAPVTSTSILAIKSATRARKRSTGSTASHIIGGPPSTDSLIAIGRADGEVHVYDCVGLLLGQHSVGEKEEKIISVEWVKGLSPKPIDGEHSLDLSGASRVDSQYRKPAITSEIDPWPNRQSDTTTSAQRRRSLQGDSPRTPTWKPSRANPSRQFAVHPDEIQEGTVRRHTITDGDKPRPTDIVASFDLFTPGESPESVSPSHVPEKRVTSPPRSRPALTSQTFLKSPDAVSPTPKDPMARRRNLELFPSTDSPTSGREQEPNPTTKRASFRNQNKRITFDTDLRHPARRRTDSKLGPVPSKRGSTVTADLRTPSISQPGEQQIGVFQSNHMVRIDQVGPTTTPKRKRSRLPFLHRSTDHVETGDVDSDTAREAYEHVHKRHKWPEDSNQGSSLDMDIWLTSDSANDAKSTTRRQLKIGDRPPARQTSRSRVTSKGTMSTMGPAQATIASPSKQALHLMDGSTEEEMFTADTHFTSSGTFSPSSKDVRGMFPRSTSLSPRKGRGSRKQEQYSPVVHESTLKAIASVEGINKIPNSPWVRAKAMKTRRNGVNQSTRADNPVLAEMPHGRVEGTNGKKKNEKRPHCNMCSATKSRVLRLEAETAHLKAEVLIMKTALKQQGLALPRPFWHR